MEEQNCTCVKQWRMIMPSYFYPEWEGLTILFQSWIVNSVGQLWGSLIALFIMSLAFEAVKYVKFLLTLKRNQMGKSSQKLWFSSLTFVGIVLLYGVQVVLGYWVMLVTMYFNTYFFIAIILGLVTGYTIFFGIETYRTYNAAKPVVNQSEECHCG